jgi:hypothetical protein
MLDDLGVSGGCQDAAPCGHPSGPARPRSRACAEQMRLRDSPDDFELSDAEYLIRIAPSRDHAFFSNRSSSACSTTTSFKAAYILTQDLHLVACRRSRCVARKAAFAGFQEVLRPAVVTCSRRCLRSDIARRCWLRRVARPAQCGSSPPPLTACGSLGGYLSPAAPRLTAASQISGSSSLLHRYDEPEILPSSIQPRCLIGADPEHSGGLPRPILMRLFSVKFSLPITGITSLLNRLR